MIIKMQRLEEIRGKYRGGIMEINDRGVLKVARIVGRYG